MLSVVISAHNEEKNIKECLESVGNLADEIIVIDNSSTDRTGEIAKKLGAKVITQENDYKKIDLQKNFGFDHASGDWIFSLDADERITPKLSDEIKKTILLTNDISGYFVPRKNIIFGRWIRHSIWWPDYQLRLFKKGKGRFPKVSVHQPIDVKGETRHLSEPLIHNNYNSISQFVFKMNTIYTEIESEEMVKSGHKVSASDSIKMPVSDFLKTYFLQKGYKDGLHGFVLSVLQSFYMFLVFAKTWERQGFFEKKQEDMIKIFNDETEKYHKEFRYWMFTALFKEAKNPIKKITYYLGRKLL